MINRKKILRRTGRSLIFLFLLLNVIAAMHAWRFTHFADHGFRNEQPASMSAGKKLSIALTGIDNPRPETKLIPKLPYTEVTLQSNVKLSCWYLKTSQNAKGTVILFHGYGGEKSSMLDKAYLLLDAGYNVFLPDFMGAGHSEGNQTTIGFKESANVKTCYNYIASQYHERHIILFGTSMGAVAILKYLNDKNLQPAGVVLECPFGEMYKTVCARFKMVHAPTFPMAGLLVFWGGLENGFLAFGHNPKTYASSVRCPTLLLFGAKDDRVSRGEIDAIYNNLAGLKTLHTYPLAGHNNYLVLYKEQWVKDVTEFLKETR